MSSRSITAWLLGLALVAAHMLVPPGREGVLHLGWIPDELAWRLAWMALAGIYLAWFCGSVWRDDPEEGGD